MSVIIPIIFTLLGLIVGGVVGYLGVKRWAQGKVSGEIEEAKAKAQEIEAQAKRKAEDITRESKRRARELEQENRQRERELKQLRSEVEKREREVRQRESELFKERDRVHRLELELKKKEEQLQKKEQELVEKEKSLDRTKALEELAGISREQAKEELKAVMFDQARLEIAKEIKELEDQAKEEAEKRAKKIIATAIERYASEFVNERTVSVVALPNEEMKGRIIGREGRNIRAFEAATGVDLIIDDTPEAVIVSNFNPVRREVARRALEKLVQDGRVHPARIEEVVERSRKEVDQSIKEAGQDAVFRLGITDIHPELIKLLGRLKYRMSYAQNVLQHSLEVAYIAGMMAAELGLDQKLAQRAGLLHDIGKAVDHEVEGPHALIGAKLARKYGEKAEVVHAIAAHHYDERPMTVLAHLVIAADAMSGARPGARRETLENYIKRLEQLEESANSHEGVSHSYAIQAGREIRIMVENSQVSDEEAALLAREIARDIEQKMSFPGQIKVCVIRESRFVEYAK